MNLRNLLAFILYAIVDRINGSFSYTDCERTGLASRYVAYSLIILISYLFGLYTFRMLYPEYLLTLIEKVWHIDTE